MFAPIPTFAALIACFIGLDMARGGEGPALSAWALAAFAVVPVGELSVLQARWMKRRGKRRGGTFWYTLTGAAPLAGYAAACLFFGLPRILPALGIDGWVLVDEALLVAVYPAATALSRFYRHRRARVFMPKLRWRSCWNGIVLGFRNEIACMIPVMVLILLDDLLSLVPGFDEAVSGDPVLFYGFLAFCLATILALFPVLLRIFWRLKPLDRNYPARDELAALMRRQAFRARDIMVWETGGDLANAAIVGFLPRLRYILLSDRLLATFPAEEIKAVLANEIAHGKRRHAPYFIIFTVGFFVLLGLLDTRFGIVDALDSELASAGLFYLPAIAVYVWFVFGFVSRRFEVEADVFAARAVGDPPAFASALRRLEGINNGVPPRVNWRHFSVDRRIELLKEFFPDATAPPDAPPSDALRRFERRMRRFKLAGVLISLLIIGLFVLDSM